ncbi:T9SS type A sorting domain-containing protein [Dysgonomonas capnocytophagoides]|uniref:T9SS type A sorting domain-containing protein n=1 Tax=Dysgonomonas capnocytophagoides TaxID=45254 RepID=UPI00333F534B
MSIHTFSETVVIKPKATFVGVKKKGDTYTAQTLSGGILLGTKNEETGRGYLEFDLKGKIPSGAKINFAEIRLSSKSSEPLGSFGGKIRLERAGRGLNFAGSSEWNQIKTIGISGDYSGIELSYTNPSTVQNFAGELIISGVKDGIGKEAAFMINHTSENGSKYVYLDGADDKIILTVTYTTDTTTPTNPSSSNPTKIEGDSILSYDEIYKFMAVPAGPTLNWTWDNNILQYISYTGTSVSLKPYSEFVGFKKTSISCSYSITAPWGERLNGKLTKDVIVGGTNFAQTTINIACVGENVEYKIPGIEFMQDAVINWTPKENVSLISGQGTATAKFKTKGNGKAVVKVDVKWGGKTFTSENNFWVGPPAFLSNGAQGAYSTDAVLKRKRIVYRNADIGGLDSTYCPTWKNESPGFATISNSCYDLLVTFKPKVTGTVDLVGTFTNKCGSSNLYFTVEILSSNNLRSDTFKSKLDTDLINDGNFIPQSIKVYNLSGAIVHSQDNLFGDFDIKSTTLPDGIYIIEKSDGKEKQSEKVILKR